MIGEAVQLIITVVQYLWCFATVHEWEHGAYYICGRYWKTFGPGVYFVVPFFTRLIEISTVPHMLITPRLDLTLADGKVVSLTLSAWMRVTDTALATNSVNDWEHTTRELLKTVVAEKVAEIDSDRLAANRRKALCNTLTDMVQKECVEYGVEVTKVRFSTLVLNARNIRLLADSPLQVQ